MNLSVLMRQFFGQAAGMSGVFRTIDFRIQTRLVGSHPDSRNQPVTGVLFASLGVDNKDLLHPGLTLPSAIFSLVYKNTMYIVATFSSNSKRMA